MLLPVNWLKDYIDIDEDIKKIADRITNTGSHVESITKPSEGIEKVVVGRIEKIIKHPDADKLVICDVNIEDENLQIVTGAKNVFEGAIVPVALVGAKLAGGLKIKKGKLRGVESNGMLCSLEELGYDTSVIPKEARDGIFIFDNNVEVGSNALDALELYSEIIELEITPNRPDCLSIVGMARETAASFGKKLKIPEITINKEVEDINDYLESVEIDTENANRYYARVIKDIKIKKSPLWLQNYLMAAGVRPISNIVDLTNFVMLEYGEPLHAFDLDVLENKKIVVRQAKDKEIIKTLDDKDRELTEEDILITDGKNPIGIAGVMGGFDSEITSNTKNVLLEGANFNKENIRKTSKRLGLRSEASQRFEKGLDATYAKIAVDRVCELVEELGIGKVIKGAIDVYKNVEKEREIKLRVKKCNDLIGAKLSIDEIAEILERLDIRCEKHDDYITAFAPTFRKDLEIEVDLIEEVARIYGLDNIEIKPLEGFLTVGSKPKFRNVEDTIKNYLIGMGYSEFMTYSFVSPSIFELNLINEDDELRKTVNLLNPLGEDFSIMRPSLVFSMIDVLAKNDKRSNENVAGFEIGNIFMPSDDILPVEKLRLSMGIYDIGDFYYLKESIEKVLWTIGIDGLIYKRANKTFLHPGRSADIYFNDKYLGYLGEVHPSVAKNYGLKKRAYVAELDFDKIVENTIKNHLYKETAKYPAIKRDFAFVLDRDIDAYSMEEIAIKNSKDILESFKVFDIYTSDELGEDKKSVAFSLVFRANNRTLEDEEITNISQKIIEDIKKNLNGELRS